MVATLARRVARKSSRNRQHAIAQETRRKLFLEVLEDRRLLAGLDESLVTGHWSAVRRQGSVVRGRWRRTMDNGQRTNSPMTKDK